MTGQGTGRPGDIPDPFARKRRKDLSSSDIFRGIMQADEHDLPVTPPEAPAAGQTYADTEKDMMEKLSRLGTDITDTCWEYTGYAELEQLLTSMESACVSVRNLMQFKPVPSWMKAMPTDKRKDIPAERIVSVSFEDGVLTLTAPLFLLRGYWESLYMAETAKKSLLEYGEKHGLELGELLRPPLLTIIKRYVLPRRSAYYSYRDNENVETTELINSVFSVLGYPDSVKNTGYVSLCGAVSQPSQVRTEIILFSADSLKDNWKYLVFN